jgi:serine-type D-Ala-D-Ala carboxypeptidase/endopeptidase (penicillin-binding protein 4)
MKRLRKLALTLAIMLGFLPATGCIGPRAGHDPRLAARLDAVLDRYASTGAVLRARVVELPSRRELYARRIDAPCTPASNFKLLTTAAGLDMFGANYRVKTYLAMDGDDLWLIGTGDPGTGDPRLAKAAGGTPVMMLEEWAKELERRGIRRIKGDLLYDDSAFESRPLVHPTWPKPWLLDWYAAPVTGLNFNDNCVDITIYPTEPGKPVRYEVMPPASCIKVDNGCLTAAKNEPSVAKLPKGDIYKLGGGCSDKTELKSKPVDNPGEFFADALRTQLAARGITITGRIRRAEAPLGGTIPPPHDKVIAVYETRMSDILARINKNSQNLFAEALCKLTGREYEARHDRHVPGSWTNGSQALRAFLAKNAIDHRALVPMDGSGLSPQNRVTTRMLTDLLAVMYTRPDGEAYRASLSVAGVDGSLKGRMTNLKGCVFGKTGYIGGVSSVSGYLRTCTGNWLAFSIIYNHIPGKVGDDTDVEPFTKLQDEACGILAAYSNVTICFVISYDSPGLVRAVTQLEFKAGSGPQSDRLEADMPAGL